MNTSELEARLQRTGAIIAQLDPNIGVLVAPTIADALQSLSQQRQRIEALEAALRQIAGKNDLSMVADADVEAAARGALYECELIARQALGEG